MRIDLSKPAKKFILRLTEKEQKRVLNAIYKLPAGNVIPLKGRNGEFRLRLGDWRVVFEYRERDFIFVVGIDNRGDAYK